MQDRLSDSARGVLLGGTLISFALMVIGLGYAVIIGSPGISATLSLPRLLGDLAALQPGAIVGIGVIVLLLTPMVNLLVLARVFAREKDRTFVLLALLVLVIMLASVMLAVR